MRRSAAWVEYAPDVSGSPGTWQSGPLTLTELGETSGTITAGGYAFYWRRLVLPDSATPGDMAMTNDRVRGLTLAAQGTDDDAVEALSGAPPMFA